MRLLALPLLVVLAVSPLRAQQDIAVPGMTLSLPEDWDGPVESDESHAPQRSWYTFNNHNYDSNLEGASLHIVQVTGLNALERERWRRGSSSLGQDGLRPVAALGPSDLVVPNANGYRTENEDRMGNLYYTQHGLYYYAIHFTTPKDSFEYQLPLMLDVLRSISFTGANG